MARAFTSDLSLEQKGSPGEGEERYCQRSQGKCEKNQDSFMKERGNREGKPAFTQALLSDVYLYLGAKGFCVHYLILVFFICTVRVGISSFWRLGEGK